jgi:hypothetical protein
VVLWKSEKTFVAEREKLAKAGTNTIKLDVFADAMNS